MGRSTGLTENMRHFCREYIANGGVGYKAYLAAYTNNNYTDQTAREEASRMLARQDIKDYLETLRKPLEIKAINERQTKRDILWGWINDETLDHNDRLRAMDILNKMDNEYVNINRNIEENPNNVKFLDTETLAKLASGK